MADQDQSPTVRLSADGGRFIAEHGSELAEPLQPAELAVVAETPKVTKTQARAAVNMRIAGADYSEIATILSYRDAASARKVVEETLANALPDESRESLRRLTGARMEGLMKKIAPKTEATVPTLDDFGKPIVVDGKQLREPNPEQLAHVKVMADLFSRHARIMGVETLDVTITPTNEQYAATMRALLQQHGAGGAQEADPFAEEFIDAEVVEDVEEGELDEQA